MITCVTSDQQQRRRGRWWTGSQGARRGWGVAVVSARGVNIVRPAAQLVRVRSLLDRQGSIEPRRTYSANYDLWFSPSRYGFDGKVNWRPQEIALTWRMHRYSKQFSLITRECLECILWMNPSLQRHFQSLKLLQSDVADKKWRSSGG